MNTPKGAPVPHAFGHPPVPRTQERGLIGETCDQRRIISLCDLICSYSDMLTEKLCRKPGGGGATPLYGLYGDVPLDVQGMVFDLSLL